MAWPTAGSGPENSGAGWASEFDGPKSGPKNTASFKAPAGKFLPVLLDLYNGQRMRLPVKGALVPLLQSEQPSCDIETARSSFAEARDIALEALKGQDIEVVAGPMAGTKNHVRAVMLRAMVVDDKQQIVFEMDSTI